MKNLPRARALPFLSVLIVGACGDPGAPRANTATAQKPAEKATPTTPEDGAAPAAAPAANASRAADHARKPNAADARGGGERYAGGLQELESPDLSKLALDGQTKDTGADDGHDHDHSDDVLQAPLDPNAALGRFVLAEGVEQVKDFGKLRQGEIGTHDFVFVSSGDAPLVVSGVKPSCGCTKAEVALLAADGTKSAYTKGTPIPLGERFALETEINTDGRQGHFSSQVTLFGNDVRGNFTVRMAAEIEPILSVLPGNSVFFGRITTAERGEKSVTIQSTRGEPFHLSLVQEAPVEGLEVALTANEPDADGRSPNWRVDVTLGPVERPGMSNFALPLRTDLEIKNPKFVTPDGRPQYHQVQLNVQAQVVGMVSAEPAFLTFGMVRPGEAVERSLRLECHDGFKLTAAIPVTFEGLQGQPFPHADAFEAEVVPLEDGRVADLKVRLKGLPEDLNGSLSGVLRVQVGHPSMSDLQVRFSAVCRRGLPPVGEQQK